MISSDLLFHYTRNLSTLKAILKSGELWPCYSAQYGWAGGDFAIPATCFCDIPKNQIKDHVAYYGSYGLGMSKQWAKDYKVSPVFYLDVDSYFHNTIENKLHDMKNGNEVSDIFYRLLYYVKKVCGSDYDFKKTDEMPTINRKRKFYDEREWRYVPKIDYKKFVLFGNYRETKPQFNNEKIKEYGAHFKLKDVEYIIIKSESERKNIIAYIEKTFPNSSALVISKIESIENLMKNG